MQPKYAVLLQAGVKPDDEAILNIYRYLESHPDVAAASGAINIREEVTAESA